MYIYDHYESLACKHYLQLIFYKSLAREYKHQTNILARKYLITAYEEI